MKYGNEYRINELLFIEKCNPSKTRLWFPGNGLRINLFLALILASVNVFASDAPESKSEPSESQAQTGTKTDKYKVAIDVNLVTTEVRVIGKPISELKAEDFIIYDNVIPHEVALISHDQLPISFALLYIESDKIYRYPNLKVAATDSGREEDIPADHWKEIEGSFLEERWFDKLVEWLDIEAVLPDFTKGEVVRIIVR